MFLIMLLAAIFNPAKAVVLPKTHVKDIRLITTYEGLCIKIDGEYALYKKIHPDVFVRKTCTDSLMLYPDSIQKSGASFKYDLDGDGKLEKIRFKNNTLTIVPVRGKSETYKKVESFVLYDIDDNGSLDLIYVDTDSILHILHNKSHIRNLSTIFSSKPYTIDYKTKKKTYSISVLPSIVQGKIPLKGWKSILLKYNGSTIPLEKGKTVNLNSVENPVKYVVYENDTLKLGISLSEKMSYSIEIIGKKVKTTVAEGSLPQGVYRFEYFVGTLSKGNYKVVIKLNERVFTREISVK